jgi:hypothetical protein
MNKENTTTITATIRPANDDRKYLATRDISALTVL